MFVMRVMPADDETMQLRTQPRWLPLLSPMLREWREDQLRLGNDPDPYLEARLISAGKWPPPGLTDTEVEQT